MGYSIEAINEKTSLRNANENVSSGQQQPAQKHGVMRKTALVTSALTATVGIVYCANLTLSSFGNDALMNQLGNAIPLLGKGKSDNRAQQRHGRCVSMCTGVYDSQCMIVGNPDFPFPDGILSGLVLSAPGAGASGGIDYHLLSTKSEYLGPNYLEYGHYTLDESQSPNATSNCAGVNDLFYKFPQPGLDWSPLRLDMEWNTIDGGDTFSLGTKNGFGCIYVKLSGGHCHKVYKNIVAAFAEADMKLDVPSVTHMCG